MLEIIHNLVFSIKVNPVRDNGGSHVRVKISNGVNYPKGWGTKLKEPNSRSFGRWQSVAEKILLAFLKPVRMERAFYLG